jgi:polysaccharide biosynthesis transport protein
MQNDWFAEPTQTAEPHWAINGTKEFVRILFTRKWLIPLMVLLVEGGIAIGVYWWLLPTYETKARLHIDLQSGVIPVARNSSTQYVSDIERLGFFETVQQEMKTRSIFEKVATTLDLEHTRTLGRLEMIRNWYLDQKYEFGVRWGIVSWQKKRDPYAAAVAAIGENLTISRLENSTILEVAYQAHGPDEAYNTLKSVIEEYIVYRNGFIREKASGSSDFLRQEVARLRAEIRTGEAQWLDIMTKQSFHLLPDTTMASSAPAPAPPPVAQPLARLELASGPSELLEQRLSGGPTDALTGSGQPLAGAFDEPGPAEATLTNVLPVDVAPVDTRVFGILANQRTIDEMAIKLIALQEELERVLALNNENHPVVPKLRVLVETYQKAINESPAMQIELRRLQRDLEGKEKLYSDMQASYQSAVTMESEELRRLDVIKVIQEPDLPGSPKSPKRMLAFAAGAPVGLLFGLMLAIILEFLNDTVKGPDEVHRLGLEHIASLKRV